MKNLDKKCLSFADNRYLLYTSTFLCQINILIFEQVNVCH